MPVVSAIVPCLLGIAAVALQGASGVVLVSDEVAYLGIGVELSTRDATVQLSELEFYSPGYGIVLAPLLSLLPTADPWAVALVVNLACLAALGPLLWLVLRELFGDRGWRTTVAATLAASTPSLVLQVTRAWPELLLSVVVAAWAAVLARFVRTREPTSGLLAVLAAAAAFTVHRRAIAVVAVTAAVVVVVHLRSLRRPAAAPRPRPATAAWLAATLLVAVGHLLANGALDRWLKGRLYVDGDLVDAGERAVELAGGDVLPRVVGHGWSVLHATLGLALLGVVGAVVRLWRTPHRDFGVALAVVTGASIVVSAVAVADGPRVDHLLYERYAMPVAVVAVAVGLAVLLRRDGRIPLASVLVLPAATALLLLTTSADRLEGDVQKLTVPTVASVEHLVERSSTAFLDGISPIAVSAATTVVAGAVVLGRRRRAGAAAGLVAGAFALVVVAGSLWALRPFLDHWEPFGRTVAEAVRAEGGAAGPIGATADAPEPLRAVVQLRLDHPEVRRVDGDGCPPVELVVAGPAFEPAWPAELLATSELPAAQLLRVRC